jgi:hypothetical protein
LFVKEWCLIFHVSYMFVCRRLPTCCTQLYHFTLLYWIIYEIAVHKTNKDYPQCTKVVSSHNSENGMSYYTSNINNHAPYCVCTDVLSNKPSTWIIYDTHHMNKDTLHNVCVHNFFVITPRCVVQNSKI